MFGTNVRKFDLILKEAANNVADRTTDLHQSSATEHLRTAQGIIRAGRKGAAST
jgi:hypothetical protein